MADPVVVLYVLIGCLQTNGAHFVEAEAEITELQ